MGNPIQPQITIAAEDTQPLHTVFLGLFRNSYHVSIGVTHSHHYCSFSDIFFSDCAVIIPDKYLVVGGDSIKEIPDSLLLALIWKAKVVSAKLKHFLFAAPSRQLEKGRPEILGLKTTQGRDRKNQTLNRAPRSDTHYQTNFPRQLEEKYRRNLLISCSFSFFLCEICLFSLFTSAWKDSTVRSLFSTSILTAWEKHGKVSLTHVQQLYQPYNVKIRETPFYASCDQTFLFISLPALSLSLGWVLRS